MSGSGAVLRPVAVLLLALAVAGVPGGGTRAASPKSPAPAPLPPGAGSGVEGLAVLRGGFVAGVRVLAFREAGPRPDAVPLAVSAGSDASGRYRLGLRPGSYHLVAVKSQGGPWPFPAAKGDLFCYHLGNPVVVEAGKMTRVAFNMVRVGEPPASVSGEGSGIAGQVLFEDRPLARAYVQVYGDAAGNFHGLGVASVPAGDDGRFRVKLPPGSYYVLARKRQGGGMYGPPGKDDFVGYHPGNPVPVRQGSFVRLELEATTRVDLLEEIWRSEGTTAGWLEGTVADGDGRPVPGLYVLFYADEKLSGTPALVAGPTDDKGRFRVRAAAGTFHLLARSQLGGPLEAGEWHGKAIVAAGAAPAGEVTIRVSRFKGN